MKKGSALYFAGIVLMVFSHLSAQELPEGPGKYESYKKVSGALQINTENAVIRATPYTENVIRLQISRDGSFDSFSYAVVADPKDPGFTVNEKKNYLQMTSGNVRLRIYKDPVWFSFRDANDHILNEDVPTEAIRFFEGNCFIHKRTFPDEKFIGLGEKTGPLNKAGRSYTNWNTDDPSYGIYADPLYITIPFYMGIHDSLVYGIFADNSYRTDFSFGATPESPGFFGCHGGQMDYFFIYGEKAADIVTSYTQLTGRMQMPPMWSLGLHQSRWSYYPEKEVMNIARTYREKNIPADVMTLDIDYMDNYKIFTWNKDYFPQPEKMISNLRDMGFRTTVILDPGIKIEKGYQVWESGMKEKIFVKTAGGDGYYRARVWPGWCYFPDFTNPDAREWWGANISKLADQGVRGFWNDMNEPATWSKMFDPLTRHNYEGHPSTHFRAHNVYGMQMARSSYEGSLASMDERPFVLTRAGFAGVQRYSAVWTGDNVSSDAHMMLGVRLLNNIGMSGISFCGMDIPGFSGGNQLTNELFARYVSIGAFNPFFRLHAAKNTRAQEPWNFGEWAEAVAKKYIFIRYQLLPYIYSAFYESTQTGIPVQRSLALEHTFDEKVYSQTYENEYYFGPSILVAPEVSSQNYTSVYLPDDGYYDFYDDTYYARKGEYVVESTNARPVSKLPVFVKAGAVIPMHKVIESTNEDPGDTLAIHLYKGPGKTRYRYYEDDGTSFRYRQGEYYARNIHYDGMLNQFTIDAKEGDYDSHYHYIRLVFHGFPENPDEVTISGKKSEGIVKGGKLNLVFSNDPGKILITWL